MVGQGAELSDSSFVSPPNGSLRLTRTSAQPTSNQHSPTAPVQNSPTPTRQHTFTPPVQHSSSSSSQHNSTPNSVDSYYPDSTYSSFDGVLVRTEHSPALSRASTQHSNSSKESNHIGGREVLRSTISAPISSVHNNCDYDSNFLSPTATSETHESSSGEIKKKKNKKIRAAGKAMKHMLPNSNAKSREADFHKLFKSLPDGETLIQDFSCALLRDILVQGRLYISQNWFCFYANILGWETLLTIEVKKIAGIKKEKTALVINNAISISTHDEKYFFSSFMSRDSAHSHMMRVWLPTTDPNVPISSIESSTVGDDDKLSSDGYMSEDEDISPPKYPPLRNLVPPDHTGTRGVPGENVSFSAEDETCVCISHYANEHMNQDFDMNIEKMYKLLFNDDSSVQSKMKDLQKMTEYDAASWTDSTEGANERTLNYMIPLNANLGPKFAEVIEKQVLTTNSIAAKCYIVNCEVNNPNVPYGDKFFIMKRYCLTRCSDNVCRLRMTSEVQYRKAVWGMVKSIIEKNSREGISEYCDDLNTCLAEECAGPGVKVRKAVPSVRAAARMPRSASQEAGSRIGSSMQFVSNNYIALILIMMAVLLLLNLILVYRLSSITSQTCPLELLNSLPQSEEGKSEWVRILAKQQDLHKKEIERWQEVLRWISKLVSEVHVSLDKLQRSSIYLVPSKSEL